MTMLFKCVGGIILALITLATLACITDWIPETYLPIIPIVIGWSISAVLAFFFLYIVFVEMKKDKEEHNEDS